MPRRGVLSSQQSPTHLRGGITVFNRLRGFERDLRAFASEAFRAGAALDPPARDPTRLARRGEELRRELTLEQRYRERVRLRLMEFSWPRRADRRWNVFDGFLGASRVAS